VRPSRSVTCELETPRNENGALAMRTGATKTPVADVRDYTRDFERDVAQSPRVASASRTSSHWCPDRAPCRPGASTWRRASTCSQVGWPQRRHHVS
jgi:hypothetical protein